MLNKGSKKILIVSFGITFIFLFIFMNLNNNWTVDTVYGNWKVTRLIGSEGGTRGNAPYGCNIGRSITITENNILDSNLYFQNKIDDFKRIYNMEIADIETVVNDVSTREYLKEFQTKTNLILDYAGITDDAIYQYDFYSAEQDDDEMKFPDFSMYSYDYENQNLLLMWLEPGGYYLLERYKKQEKVSNIYGFWSVEYMVSRGRREQEDISYLDKYGQCLELKKNIVKKNNDLDIKVIWEKEKVDRVDFEKRYKIYEGLGIEDEELEIWYGKTQNETSIIVIPINNKEIISFLDGQWFVLKRNLQFSQTIENVENVLTGNWKINQLLAVGEVNEDLEERALERNVDYMSWWYSQTIFLDYSLYAEDAVSKDWKIEIYDKVEFQKEFTVPENIMCILKNYENIIVAIRDIYDVQEVFVILDEDIMIRERNGLWYKLVKIIE